MQVLIEAEWKWRGTKQVLVIAGVQGNIEKWGDALRWTVHRENWIGHHVYAEGIEIDDCDAKDSAEDAIREVLKEWGLTA